MGATSRNNNGREQPSATAESSSTLAEPLLPSTVVEDGTTFGGGGGRTEPVVELASDPRDIIVEQVRVDDNGNENDAFFVDESGFEQGEVQEPSCRDGFFAVLFILQAGVVLALAGMGIYNLANQNYPADGNNGWNPSASDANHNNNDDDDDVMDPTRLLLFFASTIVSIMFLSAMLMTLLLGALAEMMIQLSLVITPLTFGLACIATLAMGSNVIGAALLGVMAIFGIFYAVAVWHRIPYAAANVATAVKAVSANRGVVPTAYIMTFLTTLWTLLWGFALGQIAFIQSDWVLECEDHNGGDGNNSGAGDDYNSDDCHISTRGKWIFVGMLLSLFWTIQVLKNIFQVTIAGVVGTWWFAPEDCQQPSGCCCCSAPLRDSWGRASFYSLGSICLGSLLVAILQVLQFLVRMAREQEEEENRRQGRRQEVSLVWCLLQCVVDQLEKLVKYINQWAFVYVGLYGYNYWTSSKKVYGLFRARGWSVILNDQLVNRSLAMMQLFIGVISGGLGVVFGLFFDDISPLACFLIAMVLGIAISDVVLQVVSSAVNTIVVCFAEAPNQLRQNHPESSERLLRAWRSAYPSEFTF